MTVAMQFVWTLTRVVIDMQLWWTIEYMSNNEIGKDQEIRMLHCSIGDQEIRMLHCSIGSHGKSKFQM